MSRATVNWVTAGAVTSVKNQGDCGCCYAITAVGAIEAIVKIHTGNLIELSEQQIIDCDDGNNGCKGGKAKNVFEWVIKNGGLTKRELYPYTGVEGPCRTYMEPTSKISSYGIVKSYDERELQDAVNRQPVAVSIRADAYFKDYKDGIFKYDCDMDMPENQYQNHAVLVVGYGTTEDGNDYWLIKNSGGVDWGEDGYMRMPRNQYHLYDGWCGITRRPVYPIF